MKQYEIFNKHQKTTFYIRKLNKKNNGDRSKSIINSFFIWSKMNKK